MRSEKRIQLLLVLLFLTGIIVRVYYILPPVVMDGDSAVFALMAEEISRLKEFPAFMWLNHYAGALSSFIGAVLFKCFGVSSLVHGFSGLFLSLIWVLISMLLVRRFFKGIDMLVPLVFVFLPVYKVMALSLYPGGIQAENLLFASAIIFLIIKWDDEYPAKSGRFYFFTGVISGAGLWSTPGMIPFILCGLTVYWLKLKRVRLSRNFLSGLMGFFLGYLPAIIYNITHKGATFLRLGARALDLNFEQMAGASAGDLLIKISLEKITQIPLAMAGVPQLLLSLLGRPVFVLFVTGLILAVTKVSWLKVLRAGAIGPLAIVVCFVFWQIIFYVVFVGEHAERFVAVLYVVFPVLAGLVLAQIRKQSVFLFLLTVCLVIGLQVFNISLGLFSKRSADYPELAHWLMMNKIRYSYSDYWTAYPVIFESRKKVIISPTLYHPDFSDRYPAYTRLVRASKRPAYIVNLKIYPQAAGRIQERFLAEGISYKKSDLADFIVYYDLSRDVFPEELHLDKI